MTWSFLGALCEISAKGKQIGRTVTPSSPAAAKRNHDAAIAVGRWREDAYSPPPHHYSRGIETPRTLPALTLGLLRRGDREPDVRKIMGLNWLRAYETVWDQV